MPVETIQPRIWVDMLGTAKSHVGWSALSQASTSFLGGTRDATGGQNSEVTFPVLLKGGATYSFDLLHRKANSRGIYSMYLDDLPLTAYGASAATLDGYNATSIAATDTITGIVIATTGVYDFTMRMETKNAASSNYVGSVSGGVFANPT